MLAGNNYISGVSNAVTYVNHIMCNVKQLAGSHNVRILLLSAEWVSHRLSFPAAGYLFLLGVAVGVILVLITRASIVQVNIYCVFSLKMFAWNSG